MNKTYGQAIDDCIEILSQMYEKYQKGAIYNKEIKDALEELKKKYEEEATINELVSFLETCQDTRLVGNRKKDTWIKWIEEHKKEKVVEFTPNDVTDKDFNLTFDWTVEDSVKVDILKALVSETLEGYKQNCNFALIKVYEDVLQWLNTLSGRITHIRWKTELNTADLENELCDLQDNYSDTSREYRILGEAIEYIRCK